MPETYAFERSKDMRKKKVTSSDIAHAAGVSQATVSMILIKNIMYHFQKKRSVKWNRSRKRWDTKYRKERHAEKAGKKN